MTSLEHVSVKHALDRLSSWAGNGHGHGDRVEAGEVVEENVEEAGIGVAVTTTSEEEEGVRRQAGGAVELEVRRAEKHTEDDRPHGHTDANEHGHGHEHGLAEDRDRDRHRAREGGPGGEGAARDAVGATSRWSSRGASVRGSRTHSDVDVESGSPSRSSMRGPLGMGESSAATSWTHADVEGLGGRPSVESGRLSEEVRCRSRADRVGLEEVAIDVVVEEDVKAMEDNTGMSSSSHLRPGSSTHRDATRKEEVLVMQEEDIGEAWHPLRYNGKARSRDDVDDEGEKGEAEEDVGFSSEMNEKGQWRTLGPARRTARHLRLEFKSPSPQPWDEVDPPTDNNELYASDYYSTLNSKKFETLQKGRRRPLIPHSTYSFGPPPLNSAYGTPPVGQIGVHHPREIVRIERDYGGGELVQFSPVFPLELEGRVTPTQFHQTINDINEILISAHCTRHALVDNFLAIVTLQLSTLVLKSHYTKEMRRLKRTIDEFNMQLYNPVGLHILWPQKVAFLFLEIEYY